MTFDRFGVWVAAMMTLALFSYVFKDNPLSKMAQHIYIGVAAAYGMIVQIDSMIRPTIVTNLLGKGQWYLLIPILFGCLIYTRYFKSVAFLSRYTIAFMVGIGAGVVLARDFKSLFLAQLVATMNPITGAKALDTLIIAVGVVTTLVYFFFTLQHKGPIGGAAQAGRYFMMIAFGASFGNTVQARVSLFLGRLQFLLGDWLGILK
jgi:hypothetical protein